MGVAAGEAAAGLEESPRASVASVNGRPKPRILGLRLEVIPAPKVEDFEMLLGRVANFGLFGSGETARNSAKQLIA
jgi:hypothetical protein